MQRDPATVGDGGVWGGIQAKDGPRGSPELVQLNTLHQVKALSVLSEQAKESVYQCTAPVLKGTQYNCYINPCQNAKVGLLPASKACVIPLHQLVNV